MLCVVPESLLLTPDSNLYRLEWRNLPTYLVIPQGSGKSAGVIWGHWLMPGAANSNREEFLDEAIVQHPPVSSLS
jgi:hypothetical protein